MEADRSLLEDRLDHCHDNLHFSLEDRDWVTWEGKPYKKFLHLEDIKMLSKLSSLYDDKGGVVKSIDSILQILYVFYSELYGMKVDQKSETEIRAFLSGITLLLQVRHCIDALTAPVTEEEVTEAIKKLHPGKSPGSDGITSEFYKHFQEDIAPILALVFNESLDLGELTPS